MKELSIEGNAYDGNYKAYTELINRLEDVKNAIKKQNYGIAMDILCKPYPEYQITTSTELKESEGLRIIKAIKYGLDHVFTNNTTVFEVTKEQCLAWIEKQCEHANFRNKIQIGDKVTRNEDGVLVNLSQLKRVAKKDDKQGEQKPADNAEQKFHKGDWVVYCNDDVDLITGIEENGYSINNGGYIPFVCENEMRLWDITDAKVGDVLVSESTCGLGTWYCIFKSLDGDESMTVYCYLARDGRFETKKELCFDKDPYNTKPATKEQRDQLEKAMANAGYTFDFDKKELKKIEGTTAWSEEDEKQARQIERIVHDDGCTQKLQTQIADWFKSLKERVQPKQEWSEENEAMWAEISDLLWEGYKQSGSKFSWDDIRNWVNPKLKSLRPQNTWKPSDEQMDALHYVTNFDYGGHKATLVSLYNDLKRLLKI